MVGTSHIYIKIYFATIGYKVGQSVSVLWLVNLNSVTGR